MRIPTASWSTILLLLLLVMNVHQNRPRDPLLLFQCRLVQDDAEGRVNAGPTFVLHPQSSWRREI